MPKLTGVFYNGGIYFHTVLPWPWRKPLENKIWPAPAVLIVAVAGNGKTKKWEHIPISEVNLGLNQPATLAGASRTLVFTCLNSGAQINGETIRTAASLTPATWQNEMLASPKTAYQHSGPVLVSSLHMPLTAIAPHTSPGQPHFASSEYLWMLLGVHIPLSGRLPGMGLQILSPCSCLSGSLCTSSNCSLHCAMPGCHKCCRRYGEKWEAEKSTGWVWQAVE